jgi:hypothetical protein
MIPVILIMQNVKSKLNVILCNQNLLLLCLFIVELQFMRNFGLLGKLEYWETFADFSHSASAGLDNLRITGPSHLRRRNSFESP